MAEWTEKDTHNELTRNGYQKPSTGPWSPVTKYNHPEGHQITIDRNQYKHVKKNGETNRGHVGNLPFFMRQTHKPPKMAYEMELDIYNSKEKNAADDTMVEPKITKRFEKDKALATGDYGNVQKKYAPGVTYEEDQMKDNPRFKKNCPASNGKHDWEWVKRDGKLVGSCDNCGAEHPQNKRLKEGTDMDLLKQVLTEATKFNDPKDCDVCTKPKPHPAAVHFGRALAPENQVTEDEVKGNDTAEHCEKCGKVHAPSVPCPKKNVLFGDEVTEEEVRAKCVKCNVPFKYTPKSKEDMRNTCTSCNKIMATGKGRIYKYEPEPVDEGMKFSREHKSEDEANRHRDSLKKQGYAAWTKRAPDGVHSTFWQTNEAELQETETAKEKRLALGKAAWAASKKAEESGKKSDHAAAVKAHQTALAAYGKKGSVIHRTAVAYHSNPPKKSKAVGAPESPAMALNRMQMANHDGSAGRNEEEIHEGKQKKFDKMAHVRAIARNVVGQPKKTSVIVPKDQRKKPKHKVDYRNMDEAEAPAAPKAPKVKKPISDARRKRFHEFLNGRKYCSHCETHGHNTKDCEAPCPTCHGGGSLSRRGCNTCGAYMEDDD